MVSHRWLPQVRKPGFKASHLSCAARAIVHGKGIVKVHGVFPSSCGQPASSPALQVRRASRQDSRTFVTPFVQVGTYPTRNFAQVCYTFSHIDSFWEARSFDLSMIGKGSGHFCHSLHVAMQFGLYLFQFLIFKLESGIQSLRIPTSGTTRSHVSRWSFLLIVCTRRVVTCSQVARDTQTFQQIARFY